MNPSVQSASSADRVAKPRSPIRRLLTTAATVALTGVFFAVSGAAILGGSRVIADRAEAVEVPAPVPRITVPVMAVERLDGFEIDRRFAGQVEAAQQTGIAFEAGGTITEILVDEGDVVAAGDVIARLDTRLLIAERNRLVASRQALDAQRELARRTAERQEELQERGFASSQQTDQATLTLAEITARQAEIDAGLLAVDVRLEKAEIRAPFDGRIASRSADIGATVGGGQTVVALVEDVPPRFRVGLAPDLADRVHEETRAIVTLGDTQWPVALDAILPEVDPITRTRKVLFAFDENHRVLLGDTGTITLTETITQPGFWVPLAALRDGVRGTWTVMTVDESADASTAAIEAVQIIHADSLRAYVSGTLPDRATIVADGGHQIVVGQALTTIPATGGLIQSADAGAR